MSVDGFLGRRFVAGRYDCLDFAREVWLAETGEDLRQRLDGLFVAAKERAPSVRHFRAFMRLRGPESPCIVLMRRPRTQPHVGVFLRDRVLHLHHDGVEFQPLPLAARGFTSVEFFR